MQRDVCVVWCECRKDFDYGDRKHVVDAVIDVPCPGVTLFVGPHASGKSLLSYMVYHTFGGISHLIDVGACTAKQGVHFNRIIYLPSERTGLGYAFQGFS